VADLGWIRSGAHDKNHCSSPAPWPRLSRATARFAEGENIARLEKVEHLTGSAEFLGIYTEKKESAAS